MISNLQAVHYSLNSYNGKAQLIDDNENIVELQSYSTIVAVLNREKQTIKVNGYYSPTTARHINEFLLQNGFNSLTKKEMEAKPTLTKNK